MKKIMLMAALLLTVMPTAYAGPGLKNVEGAYEFKAYRASEGDKEYYQPLKEVIEHQVTGTREKSQLADLYCNMGIVNSELGLEEEAFAAFKTAARLDPNYASTYYYRAVAELRFMKQEGLGVARADLDKAIALDASLAGAYKLRIQLDKYLLGKASDKGCEALTASILHDYAKLIELSKDYAQPYQERGNFYKHLGDTGKAEADFASAQALIKED